MDRGGRFGKADLILSADWDVDGVYDTEPWRSQDIWDSCATAVEGFLNRG